MERDRVLAAVTALDGFTIDGLAELAGTGAREARGIVDLLIREGFIERRGARASQRLGSSRTLYAWKEGGREAALGKQPAEASTSAARQASTLPAGMQAGASADDPLLISIDAVAEIINEIEERGPEDDGLLVRARAELVVLRSICTTRRPELLPDVTALERRLG